MMETQILRSCKENDASFPRIGTVPSLTKTPVTHQIKEGLPVYISRKYFLAKRFRAARASLKPSGSPETGQIDRKRVSEDWSISM